jgi:transposase-like protein
MKSPQTLQQAVIHFANADNCLTYMVAHRWPNGVECPTCGRKDASYLANQKKWQCKSAHAKRQFTVKVGTIFEDSPLGLEKWLPCVWLIATAKNGVSSCEIARSLGVTQKTAWFMLHRIRKAMASGSLMKMGGNGGTVEVDETFIGGKARNMHVSKRRKAMEYRHKGKTVVLGLLERGGTVRTEIIEDRDKTTLHSLVKSNVEKGSELMTDEFLSYWGLNAEYAHNVINHAYEYAKGHIHTNGMENFWSLLKRGLNGTYVSVEPFHLFRYLDEQVFRYNNRATKENPVTDSHRFSAVLSQVAGKRLTYAEVTGKVGQTAF